MVADSSLTPSVALLVRPRGTTHSIVDCREFTGSQPVKADLALPSVCLDSAGVWLSCQAIMWISVLAGFLQIRSHFCVQTRMNT